MHFYFFLILHIYFFLAICYLLFQISLTHLLLSSDTLLKEGSKICIKEGATNNLPDETAFGTARDIYRLISNLTAKDLVIVLMSGMFIVIFLNLHILITLEIWLRN